VNRSWRHLGRTTSHHLTTDLIARCGSPFRRIHDPKQVPKRIGVLVLGVERKVNREMRSMKAISRDALMQLPHLPDPLHSVYVIEEPSEEDLPCEIPELVDEMRSVTGEETYEWLSDSPIPTFSDSITIIEWTHWWESETCIWAPQKRSWIRRLWQKLATHC
jgi:hypothetical protein